MTERDPIDPHRGTCFAPQINLAVRLSTRKIKQSYTSLLYVDLDSLVNNFRILDVVRDLQLSDKNDDRQCYRLTDTQTRRLRSFDSASRKRVWRRSVVDTRCRLPNE